MTGEAGSNPIVRTAATSGSKRPADDSAFIRLRRAAQLSRALPEALRLLPYLSKSRNALFFGGALGDDLLCTALIHEYSIRGVGPTAIFTQHPSLFESSPDHVQVVCVKPHSPSENARTLLELARRRIKTPTYSHRDWDDDRDSIPTEHIIAAMCRQGGLAGEISLRPYLFLTQEERRVGSVHPQQVLIQSSGSGALFPMANKEWFQGRFQSVVDIIRNDFHVIQVGSESDPPIRGARDLRGKTSVRETAALLANSVLFVGLVGFLMHLARSVDCRSVIVYGGREKPWQSGYVSNINLTGDTPCSPCWRWNTCDYEHECMKMVSSDACIDAVFKQAGRHGSPLECQTTGL